MNHPTLLRADARRLPLADESVDLVVTSPPYFGLRSYTDGGEHYAGQVGAEATPAEFVAALIECTREMVRVLKPTGSIFVNLGDKYSGAQAQNFGGQSHAGASSKVWAQTNPKNTGIPNKSLMLLPERYRIAAVDELGLIARAVIVWSKLNGLPESVTDRVRRSHEDWVHLTKAPRYFSAVDEIRERHTRAWTPGKNGGHARQSLGGTMANLASAAPNGVGKLPGSVWEIATQPLKVPAELEVDHFAAFPMEWPRRLILGWSPREVCTVCGEGRRPVTVRSIGPDAQGRIGTLHGGDSARFAHRTERKMLDGLTTREITGTACGCPDTTAPSTPGVVLDPFGGTGTTALVAAMLGRRGISVDLSADYGRLARWRANDPKERARAAGLDPDAVAKVHRELDGQGSLLDLLGSS
jgi:DNA modification methylase